VGRRCIGRQRRPQADSPNTALRNLSFRAYADHMRTATFRTASAGARARGASWVAMMCAERLPWQCHRFLIADYLTARAHACSTSSTNLRCASIDCTRSLARRAMT
jgi:hypothetical protein